MPQIGIRIGATTYTWAEAAVAADAGEIPYPPPLIAEMAQQRDSQVPTASVLSGCLRRFELQRTTEYYEAAHKMLSPIFGTAFHALMDVRRREALQPGEHAEARMRADVYIPTSGTTTRAVSLSGQVDFLREGELISDWKTKKYIPKGFQPPQEHKAQVNVYNWLAHQNGLVPATEGELVYVSQDWLERFTFPLREIGYVGKWIHDRLAAWAAPLEDGRLPEPVPQFYQQDQQTGKLEAPCVYCPVLEQCRAAYAQEQGVPFGDNPLSDLRGSC